MNTDRKTVHAGADLDQGERARADIYRLLAALLAGPPDQALLDLLRALEPDTTAGTSMNSTWRELQAAAENTGPQGVGEEYFNLFIGLGRGELVPYGSWYVHGLLMEKLLASLRDELATLGFGRRDGVSERGESLWFFEDARFQGAGQRRGDGAVEGQAQLGAGGGLDEAGIELEGGARQLQVLTPAK